MTAEDSPFRQREPISDPPGAAAGWLRAAVRSSMRPGIVTVSDDASLLQVQRATIARSTPC